MRCKIFVAGLVVVLLLNAVPAAEAAEGTRFQPAVTSSRGVVVSISEQASQVGIRVLHDGGNAIDAAVATLFAVGVARPEMCGIGAGGYLVYRSTEGDVAALDFREKAPSRFTNTTFRETGPGLHDPGPETGHLMIGVPGFVRGLWEAHGAFGSIPWADAIAPAEDLARSGPVVTQELSMFLTLGVPTLRLFPAAADIYLVGGVVPYPPGRRLVQSDYAESLGLIAEDGPDAFYRGRIADLIVQDMVENGSFYPGEEGLMDHRDLAGYAAEWREPLVGTYRGHEVITMPPSTSGGVFLLETLNILEGFDLRASGASSADHLHLVREAMAIAFADRGKYMADPAFDNDPKTAEFETIPVERLTSKSYATERRKDISLSSVSGYEPSEREPGDTTHVSVIDRHGNAVAVTCSNGNVFGNAVVAEGAGFLLNNHMSDFFDPGRANQPDGGKRPLSSMTPAILVQDGRPILVTGGAGGPSIPQAVVQNVLRVVDFGEDIAHAMDAERQYNGESFSVGGRNFTATRLESVRVSPTVQANLTQRGHVLAPLGEYGPPLLGIVQSAGFDPGSGQFQAISDPRAEGSALGVNEPPQAAGRADWTKVDRVRPVHFTDLSTGGDGRVVRWRWDFGDGKTSTDQHPSHLYKQLGTFDVTLTVWDDCPSWQCGVTGDSDTAHVATITVRNIPPASGFHGQGQGNGATSVEVEANRIEPVSFADTSADSDGSVVSWRWDFGDGATSTEQNPSHQYTQLGTFTVRLTVTDNDGDTGSSERSVRVVNLLPTAAFEVDPAHPMVLASTDFLDASTDPDGTLAEWSWDLGDGSAGKGATVGHRYLQGGWYDVRLRATDNDGGVAYTTASIYVCSPGGDVTSLLEPGHVRLEVEACVHVGGAGGDSSALPLSNGILGIAALPMLATIRGSRLSPRRCLGAAAVVAAAGFLALGGAATPAVQDDAVFLGELGVEESMFWNGPFTERALMPDSLLALPSRDSGACEAFPPCWDYLLQVQEGGARLRVALDWPGDGNRFGFGDGFFLEIYSPSGEFIAGGSGVYSREVFLEPLPGTWTLRVIPFDVEQSAFRMRAKLEGALPEPPFPAQPMLPDFQMVPPFDFGFVAPATLVGPAVGTAELAPFSCTVDDLLDAMAEGSTPPSRCLRMSFGPANAGEGPFRLTIDDTGNLAPAVTQHITWTDGSTTRRPAGAAFYHESHHHYHIDGFGAAELLKVVDPIAGTLASAGEGRKIGFCPASEKLWDWTTFFQSPRKEVSHNCGDAAQPPAPVVMGMSTGWADIYEWQRPSMYVDFGDNEDGLYVVRVASDHGGLYEESDLTDNVAYSYVDVRGNDVRILERGRGADPWDPAKVNLNVPPEAQGVADTKETDRLTPVQFTDQSTDGDGRIVTWSWDFGDGSGSGERNPAHRYERLGKFRASLKVVDEVSGADTAEVATIHVKNIPPAGRAATPGEEIGASALAAEITANRVEPVQFTDVSTDADGSIVGWRWDFGDGATGEERNPSHQYSALGTFTARVEPTDNDGDTGSPGTRTVRVVNLLPTPDFAHRRPYPNILEPVEFQDASSDRDGEVVAWAWDFGDGHTSEDEQPWHVFLRGGWHTIALTVEDNDGGIATLARDIYVCNPTGEYDALAEPQHIRVEYQACLRLDAGDRPLVPMGAAWTEHGAPMLLWAIAGAVVLAAVAMASRARPPRRGAAKLLWVGFAVLALPLVPDAVQPAEASNADDGIIELALGEAQFWYGPFVVDAGARLAGGVAGGEVDRSAGAPVGCDSLHPCWRYLLRTLESGTLLRVALDWPNANNDFVGDGDAFSLEVLDQQGSRLVYVSRGGPYSLEAFVSAPPAALWTVVVIPNDATETAFRLRAALEGPAPVEPGELRPNFRMVPPFDIGFTPAASRFGPPVEGAEAVPCRPDEVLLDMAVRCLRLSTGPENIGQGLWHLAVGLDEEGFPVSQKVYGADGSAATHPAGAAVYHAAHGHFHLPGLIDLRLLRVADPVHGTLEEAGEGQHHGYCFFRERVAEWGRLIPGKPRNVERTCGNAGMPPLPHEMSLSAGWSYVYEWPHEGAYVEFGDNPDGDYVVRATINAAGLHLESNATDNAAYALVRVFGNDVQLLERGYGSGPGDAAKTVLASPPAADGEVQPRFTDRVTPVQFTDSSRDRETPIVRWRWDFGDGSTSDLQHPSHTYAQLGRFPVSLSVTDFDGEQARTSLGDIDVQNLLPRAAGEAGTSEADRVTPVQFRDLSRDLDGRVVAWQWSFGDGTTSTEQHPAHLYTRLGAFHVTLRATDDDGGAATADVARIKVKNLKPHAGAEGDGGLGQLLAQHDGAIEANRVRPVQFEDRSTDDDGTVVGWEWDFGDGASSTEQNPSHRFTQLGTFTVRLTVTDNDGDAGSSERTVRVVNLLPTAEFAVDPAHPMVLALTDFLDASSDPDGTPAAWGWAFGDGATAKGQQVSHRYLEGGWYDVRLSIADNDGGAAMTTARVYVCSPGGDAATLLDPGHVRLEFEACIHASPDEMPRLLPMGSAWSESGGPLPGLLWLAINGLVLARRRRG